MYMTVVVTVFKTIGCQALFSWNSGIPTINKYTSSTIQNIRWISEISKLNMKFEVKVKMFLGESMPPPPTSTIHQWIDIVCTPKNLQLQKLINWIWNLKEVFLGGSIHPPHQPPHSNRELVSSAHQKISIPCKIYDSTNKTADIHWNVFLIRKLRHLFVSVFILLVGKRHWETKKVLRRVTRRWMRKNNFTGGATVQIPNASVSQQSSHACFVFTI